VVYTNKDLKFSTQGGMEILVPMGSRVETNKLKSHGAYFVNPSVFPKDSIERHDATYYGFRVLPEDTMEIKPEGGEI